MSSDKNIIFDIKSKYYILKQQYIDSISKNKKTSPITSSNAVNGPTIRETALTTRENSFDVSSANYSFLEDDNCELEAYLRSNLNIYYNLVTNSQVLQSVLGDYIRIVSNIAGIENKLAILVIDNCNIFQDCHIDLLSLASMCLTNLSSSRELLVPLLVSMRQDIAHFNENGVKDTRISLKKFKSHRKAFRGHKLWLRQLAQTKSDPESPEFVKELALTKCKVKDSFTIFQKSYTKTLEKINMLYSSGNICKSRMMSNYYEGTRKIYRDLVSDYLNAFKQKYGTKLIPFKYKILKKLLGPDNGVAVDTPSEESNLTSLNELIVPAESDKIDSNDQLSDNKLKSKEKIDELVQIIDESDSKQLNKNDNNNDINNCEIDQSGSNTGINKKINDSEQTRTSQVDEVYDLISLDSGSFLINDDVKNRKFGTGTISETNNSGGQRGDYEFSLVNVFGHSDNHSKSRNETNLHDQTNPSTQDTNSVSFLLDDTEKYETPAPSPIMATNSISVEKDKKRGSHGQLEKMLTLMNENVDSSTFKKTKIYQNQVFLGLDPFLDKNEDNEEN